MAKLEMKLNGNFDTVIRKIEDDNGPIHLSAITSGGSQALFFKVNTFGEEAFLDKLRELF